MVKFQFPPPDAPTEMKERAMEDFKALLKQTMTRKSAEEQKKLKDELAFIEANKQLYNVLPASCKQPETKEYAIMNNFMARELKVRQEIKFEEERDWDQDVEAWLSELLAN